VAEDELETIMRRRRAWWEFVLGDYAFLRPLFPNVKRVGPDLFTSSQPWPFQLKAWRDRGVRTVIDLRGRRDRIGGALEDEACAALGVELIELPLKSREPPTAEQVRRIKTLAETLEGPVLAHCKSGADRAGLFAALWRHFRTGEPIARAASELGFRRRGHFRGGKAGVLGFTLARYLADSEPRGIGFLEWVESPAYDPKAIKAAFRASWWGTLLSDRLLRRE
jgi:protein tyrosine/serine phosphatase